MLSDTVEHVDLVFICWMNIQSVALLVIVGQRDGFQFEDLFRSQISQENRSIQVMADRRKIHFHLVECEIQIIQLIVRRT